MRYLDDNGEEQAQGIACTHLIRGCEDPVSDLVLATGESGEQPAIMQRAQDILAQVLSSWRETLDALKPGDLSAPAAEKLDAWTSDELFAAAVERRAEDAPALALWVMHATLLRALIDAHGNPLDRMQRPAQAPPLAS